MINRRQFLKITGSGTASLLMVDIAPLININRADAASNISDEFLPDLDIALKATPTEVPIFPGDPTGVWYFKGEVVKGNRVSLIN